jgi:hypothetical protein
LLRNPGIFGRAASWDAPLAMGKPGRWQTDIIWPTQAAFDEYSILRLLGKRAALLRSQPPRLALMGYGKFPEDGERAHGLMENLRIPHVWLAGPEREHSWRSGWLGAAVEYLAAMKPVPPPGADSPP